MPIMRQLAEQATEETETVETASERRQHRRHDLEPQAIMVERWHGPARAGQPLGRVVDLSSGGMRIRTRQPNIRADQQIRLRVELPPYAGIFPFIDATGPSIRPSNQWVGWMAVSRVESVESGEYEIAGRLMDMDELDRGMLGLYLSTQPMAA